MTILVVLSSRHLTIACTKTVDVRPNLNCAIPVEIPYYGANVGRKDICGHCGCAETQIDLELKKTNNIKQSYLCVLRVRKVANCQSLIDHIERNYSCLESVKHALYLYIM